MTSLVSFLTARGFNFIIYILNVNWTKDLFLVLKKIFFIVQPKLYDGKKVVWRRMKTIATKARRHKGTLKNFILFNFVSLCLGGYFHVRQNLTK
jgi:hypothetical protein